MLIALGLTGRRCTRALHAREGSLMQTRNVSNGLVAVVLGTLIVLGTATRAAAQEEKVIHSFQPSNDGIHPYSALILDASGNLYGTASDGGAYGLGTVFEFSPRPGGGSWGC